MSDERFPLFKINDTTADTQSDNVSVTLRNYVELLLDGSHVTVCMTSFCREE